MREICNLVVSVDREDLDEALSHMLVKLMVADVDVLGLSTKLWQASQFKSALVVFKSFAIDMRFSANEFESTRFHLLQKLHHRNDITERLRESNVFSFSG